MNWLKFFILTYVLGSIFLALYAGRRVRSSQDYVMAGRHLSFPISTATIIASWFGASSILGSTGKFIQNGLAGILMDPFSAAFCLILIACIYAKKIYRCQTITIGDYFYKNYGKNVSILFSLFSTLTYVGWIAAQIQAFSIIMEVLSNHSMSREACIVLSSTTIVLYTIFGGMWSVALTDFLQTTVIICSMIVLSFIVFQHIPLTKIFQHAQASGKFNLFEGRNFSDIGKLLASFLFVPFGILSQQDVFQRINSAKTERIVVNSSIFASILYIILGLCPITFGYAATLISPTWAAHYIQTDPQLILPEFALQRLPFFASVLFFGAIVSGLMGTASAGLLASSVIVTKNLLYPMFNIKENDRFLLTTIRTTSVAMGFFIILFNLYSKKMIFDVILNSFSITSVFIFVPFNICLFFPERSNKKVAYYSIVCALAFWTISVFISSNIPSPLFGFMGSALGAAVGLYLTRNDKKVLYDIP